MRNSFNVLKMEMEGLTNLTCAAIRNGNGAAIREIVGSIKGSFLDSSVASRLNLAFLNSGLSPILTVIAEPVLLTDVSVDNAEVNQPQVLNYSPTM